MKRLLTRSVLVASFVLASALGGSLALSRPAHAVEVSFEPDNTLPIVYINVAVKAGSAYDPAGQSGLTNFLGEMLLRGTKSRNKDEIDLAIDQMGARLEVETRAEALIFRGAVLKSQLDPFLSLVSEILTAPSFPESEIKKLKSEVSSQILGEEGNDQSLASRMFNEFLFQAHPYGKPILGSVKDINHLSRAEVEAQYNKLIHDQDLLVVGTGDASQAKIQAWAKALGEARPGGSGIEKVVRPQDAATRRLLLVDKPDRTQTQIDAGQIGVRMTDKDYFPLYLGNYAFGGGSFSARLMTEIRVKRGWSYGAYSYFRQGRQPREWQIHLFPASKDTAAALELTLKMVEDVKEHGITSAEFKQAQESLVNSAGFMYNTPKKRVENKLLERTLDLPDGFMKSYGPELSKVSLDEVNSSLASDLKPDHLAITVVCTAKDLKDALMKAAGVNASQTQVVPYTKESLY